MDVKLVFGADSELKQWSDVEPELFYDTQFAITNGIINDAEGDIAHLKLAMKQLEAMKNWEGDNEFKPRRVQMLDMWIRHLSMLLDHYDERLLMVMLDHNKCFLLNPYYYQEYAFLVAHDLIEPVREEDIVNGTEFRTRILEILLSEEAQYWMWKEMAWQGITQDSHRHWQSVIRRHFLYNRADLPENIVDSLFQGLSGYLTPRI